MRAAWVETVMRHRLGTLALFALYVALGVEAVHAQRYLHDEGLLTYVFARFVREAPLASMFCQKVKAVGAAPYALLSRFGVEAVLVAHVLVGAMAIPLASAIARELRLRFTHLPALFIATSPLFLAAGPAGLSNGDGVVGSLLAVYLLIVRRRVFAAGVILGMLPWIRFELAIFVGVLAVFWLASRRDLRIAFGIVTFPLLYALAGALYHRDLLWIAHYPPALPKPMPGNAAWVSEIARHSLASSIGSMLAVTPVVAIAILVRPSRLPPIERCFYAIAALDFAALLLLPTWQVFNFGYSPRYLLVALPWTAFAAARVLETLGEGWYETPLLVGSLFVAWATRAPAPLVVVLIVACAVAVTRAFARSHAVALAVVLAAIAPFLFARDGAMLHAREKPQVLEAAHWIEQNGASRPIYTNVAELSTFMARQHVGSVHYLVQADQLFELVSLTNPHNGQRDVLLGLVREHLYGGALLPFELRPEALPAGSLLVLRDDARLERVLPGKVWRAHLKAVHQGNRLTIAELSP